MSKNKKLLSYTSFPRIDIIKGTGIRDKKHTSQKKTNIYENYLSEKRFNNFAGKMMKNLPFTRPPCTIGVF